MPPGRGPGPGSVGPGSWPAAVTVLVVSIAAAGCGDTGGRAPAGTPDTASAPSAAPAHAAPRTDSGTGAVTGGREDSIPPAGPAAGDSVREGVAANGPLTGYDTVFAYFTARDETRVPAARAVPDTADALRAAFDALLRGPTAAERDRGVQSWFSDETAGMVRDVSVTEGFAVVDLKDLRPVIPNAVSSAGALMLLGELTATAFQFPGVRRVELRIDGDCDAFMAWLQFGCHPIVRSGWEAPQTFRTAVPADRHR